LSVGEGPAAKGWPVVKDECKLFSEAAVKDATEKGHEIKKDYKADLFIETTRERPPATDREKREWFGWRKRSFRNETLDRFAEDRADELYTFRRQRGGTFRGIYVVIVEDGGKREVGVAPFPGDVGADDAVTWVKR